MLKVVFITLVLLVTSLAMANRTEKLKKVIAQREVEKEIKREIAREKAGLNPKKKP